MICEICGRGLSEKPYGDDARFMISGYTVCGGCVARTAKFSRFGYRAPLSHFVLSLPVERRMVSMRVMAQVLKYREGAEIMSQLTPQQQVELDAYLDGQAVMYRVGINRGAL